MENLLIMKVSRLENDIKNIRRRLDDVLDERDKYVVENTELREWIDEKNQMIENLQNKYETLDEKYNDNIIDYNNLVDRSNDNIIDYNELVDECNDNNIDYNELMDEYTELKTKVFHKNDDVSTEEINMDYLDAIGFSKMTCTVTKYCTSCNAAVELLLKKH